MSIYQAKVKVRLRPSVLDPAGEATKAAANRLGVKGVSSLRIGKIVEFNIEASDEKLAKEQVELLSDRLFANPVIEDWEMEIISSAEKTKTT